MAENLLAWAKDVIDRYEGRVSRLLGLPVPDGYEVRVVNPNQMPAGNVSGQLIGGILYLNKDLLSKQNEGLVVHELTHAFQVAAGVSGKKREVVADYVRWRLGLTTESDGSAWTPSAKVLAFAERSPQEVRQWMNRQEGVQTGTGSGGLADAAEDVVDAAVGAASDVIGAIGGTGGGGKGGGFDFEPPPRGETTTGQYTRQFFLAIIQGLGMSISGNLRQLADEAADQNYTSSTFLFYLRQTSEYRDAFRGIFNKDGSMKMTEEQYLSNVEQYKSLAAQAGINIGEGRIGWLFRNNVSPAEFAVKAPAIGRVNRNKDLFKAFGREAVQAGIAKPGELDNKSLFRFAAGLGNQAWADLWQDTLTRNAALEAGINIKRKHMSRDQKQAYTSINQGLIEQLSGKGLSEDAMSEGFQQLAEHLLTTMPLSKIQGFGLSKRQLTQAIFGGRNQADIRKKMLLIARTDEAFYKDRAAVGIQQSEAGGLQTVGRPQQAAGA